MTMTHFCFIEGKQPTLHTSIEEAIRAAVRAGMINTRESKRVTKVAVRNIDTGETCIGLTITQGAAYAAGHVVTPTTVKRVIDKLPMIECTAEYDIAALAFVPYLTGKTGSVHVGMSLACDILNLPSDKLDLAFSKNVIAPKDKGDDLRYARCRYMEEYND